jgi:hypothetical protein
MNTKEYPKLRIISDIHLEFQTRSVSELLDLDKPVREILVIAGDLGSPYSSKRSKISKIFCAAAELCSCAIGSSFGMPVISSFMLF